MLMYITGVHFAGESLSEEGSGRNATTALVVSTLYERHVKEHTKEPI